MTKRGLHPQVEAYRRERHAAGARPVHELSVAEARAAELAEPAPVPPEPVARVLERVAPGPDGEIPVRLYLPDDMRPAPVLVFFFGGGYWWGSRLTELGRTESPRSLWVSIGLAALFLTLAFVQAVRRESEPEAGTSARQRLVEAVRPWRWSVARLASFALFNTAAAAGIAVGFSSRPLG